ncbi:NAD(P)-dependent alcohol dehydrogenase [Nocardia pseudovaccinii]|uniref:NAD(P)-dependent alcohol dehydrogenase n=1 Tax=Nocardia pseudovaccinii TaxID=189540 RepID=UPI003D8D530B
MRTTFGWQTTNGLSGLSCGPLERRDLRSDDIAIRVDFCGICHADLYWINASSDGILVPGHEFTGTIIATGPQATRFSVGDRVAVGIYVDSCGQCTMCRAGEENYCRDFPVKTYGGVDRVDQSVTLGGCAREYVMREDYAYALPAGLDPAASAALMCAGATVWEPLRSAKIGPGHRVAVAGLGGLGHIAVKLAAALGAEVTVLSRNLDKAADALDLGAVELLPTTDENKLASAADRFDLIIDTISERHDVTAMIRMVALDGTLALIGWFGSVELDVTALAFGRKKLTSSATAGRRRTSELLEFCAEQGIAPTVEVLPSAQISHALARLGSGDVHYRFVLDLSDLDRP